MDKSNLKVLIASLGNLGVFTGFRDLGNLGIFTGFRAGVVENKSPKHVTFDEISQDEVEAAVMRTVRDFQKHMLGIDDLEMIVKLRKDVPTINCHQRKSKGDKHRNKRHRWSGQ